MGTSAGGGMNPFRRNGASPAATGVFLAIQALAVAREGRGRWRIADKADAAQPRKREG